jgi:hypothetical protein
MRSPGLKPALILEALRGAEAEASLFHGTARIWEFFRNLFKAVPFPST